MRFTSTTPILLAASFALTPSALAAPTSENPDRSPRPAQDGFDAPTSRPPSFLFKKDEPSSTPSAKADGGISILDGLTGGLLGGVTGNLGGLTGTVSGLAGGLTGGLTGTLGGLTEALPLSTVLGLLGGQPGAGSAGYAYHNLPVLGNAGIPSAAPDMVQAIVVDGVVVPLTEQLPISTLFGALRHAPLSPFGKAQDEPSTAADPDSPDTTTISTPDADANTTPSTSTTSTAASSTASPAMPDSSPADESDDGSDSPASAARATS